MEGADVSPASGYSRRVARVFGMSILVIMNAMAGLAVLVFVIEILLGNDLIGYHEEDSKEQPHADELVRRGYYPPSVQVDPYKQFETLFPHDVYGWFWPPNDDGGFSQRNAAVTIDKHGFRGTDHVVQNLSETTRPLAFLLGGSAAFGYRASSDATTITAYLNRAQSELLFVNAGVPGWDAAQEFMRLKNQIIRFSPKLVISFTLFNDIERTIEKVKYAEGPIKKYLSWLAPETTYLIESFVNNRVIEEWQTTDQATLRSQVDKQVDVFIQNQTSMHAISRRAGFRFITVIQPMTMTHNNVSIKGSHPELYQRAVARALRSDYCRMYCMDYSKIFDEMFTYIPVFYKNYVAPALDREVDAHGVVFADQCHLLDLGNEIVAKRLVSDLAGR